MTISSETLQRILDMHAIGMTVGEISRRIKCGYDTVRRQVDDAYREAANVRNADRRRLLVRDRRSGPEGAGDRCLAPPSVLEERDAAYVREYSIKYDILGEPAPGRSALDKMNAQATGPIGPTTSIVGRTRGSDWSST